MVSLIIDQQWLKKKMKMDSKRSVTWSLKDLRRMALSISKAGLFSGPRLEDGKLVPSSLVRLPNAMAFLTYMLSTHE